MGHLEIVKYPDSVLRKKCKPVAEITQKEIELFNEMLHLMHTYSGIGLAAPQVGIPFRIFVTDIGEGKLIKLANPSIVKTKGGDKMAEGCLSLPEINVEIKRPSEIVVVGLNESGKVVEIKAKGLLARVIQHEIDHLNGKLIIDYAGMWKKMQLKSKLGKKM